MNETSFANNEADLPPGKLPHVSVIVVTKGNHAEAEAAVTSILAADYPEDRREIVVVEETDKPLPVQGPGVRYVVLAPRNLGVGAARNEGLRQAARPAQPVGQQDQEQHGEAHAPHIRLDAQQDSQQVAQDDARKMTGGQGRHSVDDHVRKRRRRLTWFQLDGLKFQGSRSSIFA